MDMHHADAWHCQIIIYPDLRGRMGVIPEGILAGKRCIVRGVRSVALEQDHSDLSWLVETLDGSRKDRYLPQESVLEALNLVKGRR